MQKPRAKEFFNWQRSNYEKMDIVTGTVCLGSFEKETGDIVGQVTYYSKVEGYYRVIQYFENKTGTSIYKILPKIIENTFEL